MIRFVKQIATDIINHALGEDPNECCGILVGKEGIVQQVYRITNTASSPYRYLMDPQEFLNADKECEQNGLEFLAFYHSHTHSPAYPSPTDVRMALDSGWIDISYVLVSLQDKKTPEIHAYRIDETGEIQEENLTID